MGLLSDIIGGAASVFGAKESSDAQRDASRDAIRFQREAFNTQLGLARPQLEVANSALAQLASIFGLQAPSPLSFGGIGGGGPASTAQATQGLSIIPGATWQGRPVFTDGQGGIYSVRGRDATLENSGVSLLGFADEGPLRFFGKAVKGGNGTVVTVRDGQLRRGRGRTAEVIEPQAPVTAETATQAPQTASGLDLNQLVENNPLIRFNREQGEKAIARGAAARGLNQSGGTLQDLVTFNQDLAGAGIQQFALNPLFQLAGFGPQASSQIGAAAQAQGANLGNLALGAGQARGSAFQNAGNTIGNIIAGNDAFGGVQNRLTGLFNRRATNFSPSSSVNTGIPGSKF